MKTTKETDMLILSQLYSGNHLEPNELERAQSIIFLLAVELKQARLPQLRTEFKAMVERFGTKRN